MKVELWYNDASYHHSQDWRHSLTELLVREDRTAQLLLDSGERLEFPSEEEAIVWLLDEEYRRLADLRADLGAAFYEPVEGATVGLDRLAPAA